jgi:hypothetical protein
VQTLHVDALADLAGVMLAMQEMEFAPLLRGEWAQSGIVEDVGFYSEALFTGIEAGLHAFDLSKDLCTYFFGRRSSRHNPLGRLKTTGHVAETENEGTQEMMFDGGWSSKRGACFQAPCDSFIRVGVSQVEVLEDLVRVPFALGSFLEGAVRRAGDGGLEIALQPLEIGIHPMPR